MGFPEAWISVPAWPRGGHHVVTHGGPCGLELQAPMGQCFVTLGMSVLLYTSIDLDLQQWTWLCASDLGPSCWHLNNVSSSVPASVSMRFVQDRLCRWACGTE
jgi:hypothetical protein